MEIGGYLSLETFELKSYYPNLYALNLARTTLVYLLDALDCKSVFVPYYLCDSVTNRLSKDGINLTYYYLDDNLMPIIDSPLPDDAYLLLVNHYGQLTDEKIIALKDNYTRVIVDHTQSFFQRPISGVPTFYSVRKFFGVSDGAYLATDIAMPAITEQDVSKDRMGHILGRFEEDASTHYQTLHDICQTFADESVKKMSRLTENLLNVIDYEDVRQKRNDNYQILDDLLGQYNQLNFVTPDGPLAYPFLCKDGAAFRVALAKQKIYVPIYWNNVLDDVAEDTLEYQYASNILVLPIDQRYGEAEMRIVAEAVLALL